MKLNLTELSIIFMKFNSTGLNLKTTVLNGLEHDRDNYDGNLTDRIDSKIVDHGRVEFAIECHGTELVKGMHIVINGPLLSLISSAGLHKPSFVFQLMISSQFS